MKKYSILFIVVCMVFCLLPSVGMLFFPTTQTTENKAMAEAPKLFTEDGSFNTSLIADFEDYFTQHIALRNQLIYADAQIQTKLFQESNVSGVIAGTKGWLYYSSTLSDYLGLEVLSDRDLFNLANNFAIVQNYLGRQNIRFALTIPPNKNTLYGENMPYYKSYVVDPDHSAQLLAPYLEEQGVRYLDLFQLFEEQDETLYLLRDSHWNMKGACMAYDAILDILEVPHEDYASVTPTLVKNENGDLNKMLYSFYGPLEENYDYGLTQEYTYTSGDDVEDGWIVTENENGSGTLLMFRDSFANTLIPFFSNEFQTVYYSKGEPNALARLVETHNPELVVIEKVERNISNYLDTPPILMPNKAALPSNFTIAETESSVQMEGCMYDFNYYLISGTVDADRVEVDSHVLVSVDGRTYRAYLAGESGYSVYVKKDTFLEPTTEVQVYVVTGDHCVQVLSTELQLPAE